MIELVSLLTGRATCHPCVACYSGKSCDLAKEKLNDSSVTFLFDAEISPSDVPKKTEAKGMWPLMLWCYGGSNPMYWIPQTSSVLQAAWLTSWRWIRGSLMQSKVLCRKNVGFSRRCGDDKRGFLRTPVIFACSCHQKLYIHLSTPNTAEPYPSAQMSRWALSPSEKRQVTIPDLELDCFKSSYSQQETFVDFTLPKMPAVVV